MIRVLHITKGMKRGGIETFIMNVFRNIDRNKVCFDFLLTDTDETDYTKEIKKLGGKIYYIPNRKEGLLQYKRKIEFFFEEHKEFSIVHQHVSSLTNILPLKIAKKKNIPNRIIHSHNTQQGGMFIHKYLHKINKYKVGSIATEYFACSELAARWLYPDDIYKNGKHVLINNAIDTEKFKLNQNSRTLRRKEFGIKDNEILVGHIGRFSHQKNHSFLIKIFHQMHKKNKNVRLLLVGTGPLKTTIENKVKELNLEEAVIFAGVRSDISELMQAMDIFIMPSFHEGLPVTVIEAQAASLPCVLATTITKEVEITKNIEWIGLDSDSTVWADTTLNLVAYNRREDTHSDIVNAGYDIEAVALNLQKQYINMA